jgi:hypothetical protein
MRAFCWVGVCWEAWRVARVQVIDRVVSVPRDTTQRTWRVESAHKKKVGILGTWVLCYGKNASLIVGAIAGLGHGKVGRGVQDRWHGRRSIGAGDMCGVKRGVNGIASSICYWF